MTKEDEIILEYEKKLNYAYAKANTKSKKKRLVYDLILFSNMCYEIFDIDKEFEWDKDWQMISLLSDTKAKFVETTLEYKPLFSEITKNVISIFKEINFPFYKNYGKCYSRLTDKEFQEIIFSFLNNFDPKLQKRLKDKLNNYEMFTGNASNHPGITYPIEVLNKNIIYYFSDSGSSIYNAAVVMHEFGHEFEFNNHQMTGRNNSYTNVISTPYYEVSSSFFEYAFIRYLKDNRIYEKDVSIYLTNYYYELLSDICNMSIFNIMDNIDIDDKGDVNIDNVKVSDYADWIKKYLNYYEILSSSNGKINYFDSYIYGIGSLFGIYLYENYRDDPNNFKREFRNALLNYPYNNEISVFERVGITEDNLISGDVLRKVLKNSR